MKKFVKKDLTEEFLYLPEGKTPADFPDFVEIDAEIELSSIKKLDIDKDGRVIGIELKTEDDYKNERLNELRKLAIKEVNEKADEFSHKIKVELTKRSNISQEQLERYQAKYEIAM